MKKTLAFILCAIACHNSQAQPYGRQLYPGGSVMTSGYRTLLTPANEGFIMAGINSTTSAPAPIIHIDRTSQGGAMLGTSFMKDYSVSENGLCGTIAGNPVNPNNGVCAIEANGPGYRYAFASVSTNAVFVSFLDMAGAVLNTATFRFPSPATMLRRPTIVRDNNSGAFYVCGAYNSDMYVFKMAPSGGLIWSAFYDGLASTGVMATQMYPRDMIVSAGTGEVVLVGMMNPISSAFFLALDPNTGNVNNFKYYTNPGTDNMLNSIKSMPSGTSSNGYIAGGLYLDPSANVGPNFGNALMMRLTNAGNIIWSRRIHTGMPALNNDAIEGVIVRQNTSGQTEYYGACETNNTGCTLPGLSIFKLDANGLPAAGNNEFHFDNSASNTLVNLSFKSSIPASATDEGLQVFAGNATGGHMLQHSYFNGVTYNITSSCMQNLLNIGSIQPGPAMGVTGINRFGSLIPCNMITVTDATVSATPIPICLSTTTIPGGSNAKMAADQAANSVSIYPNPGTGVYTVAADFDATLTVFDLQGKQVHTAQIVKGRNELSLRSFPAGNYLVKIAGTGETVTLQLVKE